MKVITYFIAVAALIAAAWFSYDLKTKFTDVSNRSSTLDSENSNRDNTIKKKKQEITAAQNNLDEVKSARIQAETDLETSTSNLRTVTRDASELKNQIAGQEEKLEKVETLITEIKQGLENLNIDFEGVPDYITELETEVADSTTKLDELRTVSSAADSKLKDTQGQLTDLRDRVAKRANRIRANALSGHIDSVNHDWGFVMVHVPTDMPIESTSKLIVQRGNTLIGRLKISAIEGTLITADIDQKSLKAGMVMQAGDTVILNKPVTN